MPLGRGAGCPKDARLVETKGPRNSKIDEGTLREIQQVFSSHGIMPVYTIGAIDSLLYARSRVRRDPRYIPFPADILDAPRMTGSLLF
jgi:hypothetical protein